MRILHVSMGLPPFRTGGLNRYCADLMEAQKELGEDVELLYPGEFALGNKTKIVKTRHEKFQLFRIINPLPLALTNGISEPKRYMVACKNPEVYSKFLQENRPDVIHVHSFQGIHKEFFQAAHILKIRMVFTTHDYYPFCPGCVLLQRDGSLCSGPEGKKCALCNQGRGLSRSKEIIMQSRLYERLKYSSIVKRVRAQQVNSKNTMEVQTDFRMEEPPRNCTDYDQLEAYYLEILSVMDCIHCNSRVAMDVYKYFASNLKYSMIGITHAGIVSQTHQYSKETLRIGYVGGINRYKGLSVLLEAVQMLEKAGISNYELWLYGADYTDFAAKNKHIKNGGIYTKQEADRVWESFDVLAVPSQCAETYGFVVTEALAHGVNVVCSNLVGAKDLLPTECVFRHDSPEELAAKLQQRHEFPKLPEETFCMNRHALKLRAEVYL